tara:strand:- start:314 stop:1000 length:687 start_codon:yes stop_codon:yes gene_type:complete
MKKFVLLILMVCINQISAQPKDNQEIDINAYVTSSAGSQLPVRVPINSETIGSFYLYKNWNNSGFVYLKDKRVLKLNAFNYNTYTDLFEAQISADSSFSFSKNSADSIVINNKIFKVTPNTGSPTDGYIEVLFNKKDLFFVKKYKSIVEIAKPNPMSGNFDFPDKIRQEESYYIKNDYGFVPVSLTKKSILKIFNDNEKEIKSFVKKNNLSYKKEFDVVNILNFLSQL